MITRYVTGVLRTAAGLQLLALTMATHVNSRLCKTQFYYLIKIKKMMCIDLPIYAIRKQSLKFRPLGDPEYSCVQKNNEN